MIDNRSLSHVRSLLDRAYLLRSSGLLYHSVSQFLILGFVIAFELLLGQLLVLVELLKPVLTVYHRVDVLDVLPLFISDHLSPFDRGLGHRLRSLIH